MVSFGCSNKFSRLFRAQSHADPGSHIDWHQVCARESITIYGREYFVLGCDEFTRDFLGKNGIQIPPNTSSPDGPYENAQKVRSLSMGFYSLRGRF